MSALCGNFQELDRQVWDEVERPKEEEGNFRRTADGKDDVRNMQLRHAKMQERRLGWSQCDLLVSVEVVKEKAKGLSQQRHRHLEDMIMGMSEKGESDASRPGALSLRLG